MTEEVDTGDVPEQTNDAPQEAPAKTWTDDDESEARAFGWKPSTEWQGAKPDGLIESPTEWMDRVKRSKTFSTMQDRLDRQDRENAENARRLQVMNEFALKAQREAHQRELASISAQQRQAVVDADPDRYDALERQKANLQAPVAPVQQEQPVSQKVADYRQANEWAQNPLIWGEMVAVVQHGLDNGHRFTSDADQIAYAERHIFQKYPHLAPKKDEPPRPVRPSPVETGGLAGGRTKDGFSSLPADAKAAFDRFWKSGDIYAGMTIEQARASYVEDYNAA